MSSVNTMAKCAYTNKTSNWKQEILLYMLQDTKDTIYSVLLKHPLST